MTRLWDRIVGRAERDIDADLQWSSLVGTYGMPDQERILPQFEMFAAEAFAGNSIIYALISRRINLFSEAVFKYRSLSDKHLFGTTDLDKLENPWPNGSTGELLARMEQDSSLAGNAYVRDAGSRLERLRPDWVTIVSWVTTDDMGRQVRDVIGYLFEPIGDPDRATEFFPVDEVVHWSPMPDPLANFRGMSWLTPVIRDINSDVAMTAHKEAFFRNAATPNIVIKYQQKLLATQRDLIRDTIAARHAGNNNAFGTMVLDQGADMTVVGDRMQGSAFSDLQAAGEVRLAAAAGVPAIVAGLQQGRQTGAPGEYSDAVRGFVDLTIRPNWRTVCSALSKFAAPPAGSQLWFDTADISALRQGEKDAADTMQVQAGTTNTLIMSGWQPDAVVQAVTAGDLTLLLGKHSGLTSVQMHKPGDASPEPADPNVDAAPNPDDAEPSAIAPPKVAAKSGRHARRDGWAPKLHPREHDGKFADAPGEHLIKDAEKALGRGGSGSDGGATFDRRAAGAAKNADALSAAPFNADAPNRAGSNSSAELHWGSADDPGWNAEERQEHFDAVSEYRGAAYLKVNKFLRGQIDKDELMNPTGRLGHEKVSPDRVPRLIDDITSRSRLSHDALVYRGSKTGSGVFGDRLKDDVTGFEWREDAYTSTSANQEIAIDWFARNGVVMRILVPAGTGGVQLSPWINAETKDTDEAELLLERGLRYRVVRDHRTDSNGNRWLDVEIVDE